ncbi:MAG: hypothetical protein MJ236_03050, partial [Clostridia bacterium]|nr:hypothetical protein [Clostridia bacterium]
CKGKFLCGLGNDFEDHIKVAHTTTFDGYIAVGEFHRPLPSYESPETHKFTTACGDYNEALITIYKFDEDCEFGINPVPELAFSITDKAQGLAFQDDYMYLSTSSGAAFSNIYKYDLSKVELIGVMKVDGNEFPLYGVDSACLVDTYKIAPMAEEIEFVNGKMYTMCESASNSYIFGKLTGATYCYATNLK